MGFFDRMKKGWEIAKISLRTINENRTLLVFPIISSLALIVVLLTFFGGTFLLVGDQIDVLLDDTTGGDILAYALIFAYYLVNYFVIVFFNAALTHCAVSIFEGRETSLTDGLNYAGSKIGKIFMWAAVSATVGTILQVIRDNGRIGEFVASLVGGAWSILTFFAVPIIIYEEKNVIDSVKESMSIVRQKWGESLAGSVSFGLIRFAGILLGIGVFMLLVSVAPIVGGILAAIIILLTFTITAAANTVFVAAVYNRVKERPTGHFRDDTLDGIFFHK